MKEAVEREVKLGAWPGFRLPELDVVEGMAASPATERRLEATYYDTPDIRLARSGASLRHRTGDGTGWTLKLPDGEAGDDGALTRRELTFAGSARAVPPEVEDLLTAYLRTSKLSAIAKLSTLRRSVELADEEGVVQAEVVDDEVSVLHEGRVAVRFREVEVEVAPTAPSALLGELVAQLRAAGAGAPDPTSKVRRALGPLAAGPPDLTPVDLAEDPTAGDVVRAALTASVLRLLGHDLGVRTGESAEDVHQARVATRRLRSDLRTFGDLLEEAWADELRADLKEVADALGRVRDTDVLLERLRRQAADLADEDADGAERLLARLAGERDAARADLLAHLAGRGYRALLERLVEGARSPQLTALATSPAGAVLPGLVQAPWAKLRAAARKVEPTSPDAELHEVRIRAKRARYAAEVAALALGKPASRFAKATANLQEVLGGLQDAVVTEAWLRAAVAGSGVRRPAVLAAGQLIAAQRVDAAAARRDWKAAWKALRAPALREWMG